MVGRAPRRPSGGFVGWPCLRGYRHGHFLYQHYGALPPQVQRALAGMSIVAAGLLFATFVRSWQRCLPRRVRGPWLFVMLAFVGVGVLRWPLFLGRGRARALGSLAAWKEKV